MASTSALLTTAITSRIGSILRLLLFAGFLLLGSLLLGPSPAQAEEGHASYVDTAGKPLTERTGPGTDHDPTGRQLPDGTPVTVICQSRGDSVTGTFGTSSWWDKLDTGGYVSDAFVYTGSDGQVAQSCPDSSEAPPAAAATATKGGPYVNTAGSPLTVRTKPNTGSSPTGLSLPDGTPVTVVCQVQGESVTGTFGTSSWWDKLRSGGYVSDAFVYTGSDGRVAPVCSGETTDQSPAPQPTPPPAPAPAPPPPPPPPPPSAWVEHCDYTHPIEVCIGYDEVTGMVRGRATVKTEDEGYVKARMLLRDMNKPFDFKVDDEKWFGRGGTADFPDQTPSPGAEPASWVLEHHVGAAPEEEICAFVAVPADSFGTVWGSCHDFTP